MAYRTKLTLLLAMVFSFVACSSSDGPVDGATADGPVADTTAETATSDLATDVLASDASLDTQGMDASVDLPLLSDAALADATTRELFIGSRELVACDEAVSVCTGQVAGCLLDEDHYLSGNFPGARKFAVETPAGSWKIRVLIYLDPTFPSRSPGTETEVHWYEPGCDDQYVYKLSTDSSATGDLFARAEDDGVFAVEQVVSESGTHLVTVYSDATTSYDLRIEIVAVP